MHDTLLATLGELRAEVTALRHELHRHPEIRYDEHWTSDHLAAKLTEAGIAHSRGHAGGTGIVATIEGGGPGGCVVLRADMDALEIQEDTGLPYASETPGRMHACGHDGHCACLYGVAKALFTHRNAWKGTVRCVFQPAEECGAGGKRVVEEGVLDGADAAFALHTWPGLPADTVAVGEGRVMASADFFSAKLHGQGGHGANPGATIDPVVACAHIVTALQSLVSRETNPWEPAVVTVGRIEAGQASNIIPDTALLEGTFRSLTRRRREELRTGVKRIVTDVARAFRCESEVMIGDIGYPPLHNDPAMAALAREAAIELFGGAAVIPLKHPLMVAEDFAFYLERVPGAFILLGNDAPGETANPALHSSRFDFNDDALATGMPLLADVALRCLDTL